MERARSRYSYRGVARPVGVVVIGLGAAIGVCAAIGFVIDYVHWIRPEVEGGALALALTATVTVGLGAALFAYGRRHTRASISRREATLAVAAIWLAAGVFGGAPFVIGAGMSPADAFFEAVSGLTTTGSTVIGNIPGTLSRPLLLWRSLIQWLGGMGIVVLFVAVFPNVGVGGKHMFRGEVPGVSAEGLKPRIAETSFTLWKLYAVLTFAEIVSLTVLGMDPFEAVCHGFTTMSTGGFSTRDASIAAFESPAIEMVVAVFMYIGAVNYGLYFGALRGRSLRVIFKNAEFKAYVLIVLVCVVAVTIGIVGNHGYDPLQAFRYAFFGVATLISSTGYGTDDYMLYPTWVLGLLLAVMFVGGCAGSTAGGIKVERLVLMVKQSWAQVSRFFSPNVVRVVRIGRRAVDAQVLADVSAFTAVYVAALWAGTVAFAVLEGVPVATAFGASLTLISNMGPAPFHVGPDNFVQYGAVSKLVGSFLMLLGRLELFTVLSLFVPGFWKR